MGRATEFRGIPQITKRTPPSAEQLWKLAARINTIKHFLIENGTVSKEEFQKAEETLLATMQKKRAEKIRETTFPPQGKE